MVLDLLFMGMTAGFSVAAPIGPVSLICMQRSLCKGSLHGFVSGLGIASADAVWVLLLISGYSLLGNTGGLTDILRAAGGCLLLILGIFTIRSGRLDEGSPLSSGSYGDDYLSLFLITMVNPATLVFFLASCAGIRAMVQSPSASDLILIVLSVFAGSLLWWTILSIISGYFHTCLSSVTVSWISRASGVFIIILGLFFLFPDLFSSSCAGTWSRIMA